jgi:hypothetical protein
MSGFPIRITNAGAPVTNTVGGIPVTLVGGTAVAIVDGQIIATVPVDGTDKKVTFTVADGEITAITTATPA